LLNVCRLSVPLRRVVDGRVSMIYREGQVQRVSMAIGDSFNLVSFSAIFQIAAACIDVHDDLYIAIDAAIDVQTV
jgi:hypothetical protein